MTAPRVCLHQVCGLNCPWSVQNINTVLCAPLTTHYNVLSAHRPLYPLAPLFPPHLWSTTPKHHRRVYSQRLPPLPWIFSRQGSQVRHHSVITPPQTHRHTCVAAYTTSARSLPLPIDSRPRFGRWWKPKRACIRCEFFHPLYFCTHGRTFILLSRLNRRRNALLCYGH